MSAVLTLAGEKGGIGKTTLAFHLACHLAQVGKRTLAVDTDPQGNLTYIFTGQHLDGVRRVVVQEWSLRSAILPVDGYDGRLHLLGGNKGTGEVRNLLAVRGSRLTALDGLLEQAREVGFDFVVVDTPPSPALDNGTGNVLDALTAPVLYASDFVLAPIILETLPLAGLAALSETLRLLQRAGSRARLLGVVPTMYDARTKEHATNLREAAEVYGALVYPVVGQAIAVSQCPAYGKPVWAFAPRERAGEQLRQVAERVVRDVRESS